jgi:bacillithiol system protein YtxJ
MPQIITTMDEFEELLRISAQKPVLLMKLSPVCPVSHYAQGQFENWLQQSPALAHVHCATIDVIKARPTARQLAEHIHVHHESPQAILLKDQKPVWVCNHGDISQQAIALAVEQSISGEQKL